MVLKINLLYFLFILSFISSCGPKIKRVSFNELKNSIDILSAPGSVVIENDITIYQEKGRFILQQVPCRNLTLTAKISLVDNATGLIHFQTDRDLVKGYKIMLNNAYAKANSPLTGSIYHIRNTFYPLIQGDQWFDLKVIIENKKMTVFVNEHPITAYTEPIQTIRDQKTEKMLFSEGYLGFEQTSVTGNVKIRDLTMSFPVEQKITHKNEVLHEDPVTKLHLRDFPVINFHVHLKGGMTIEEAVDISASSGIGFGIAANCGLKFPIETDMGIYQYIEKVKGYPAFTAMQAEGREWTQMFSDEAVKRFDYVFTDAMTWTNQDGQRMRLWIPEETFIGDTNDFMEQLTAQIETILTEPIDIYVNPTYLPKGLAMRYNELWTEERVNRIIAALVKNNKALEISAKLYWPSIEIIEKARDAGVKFTLGTNNTSSNIGNIDYFLHVVDSLKLTKFNLWMPELDATN